RFAQGDTIHVGSYSPCLCPPLTSAKEVSKYDDRLNPRGHRVFHLARGRTADDAETTSVDHRPRTGPVQGGPGSLCQAPGGQEVQRRGTRTRDCLPLVEAPAGSSARGGQQAGDDGRLPGPPRPDGATGETSPGAERAPGPRRE